MDLRSFIEHLQHKLATYERQGIADSKIVIVDGGNRTINVSWSISGTVFLWKGDKLEDQQL